MTSFPASNIEDSGCPLFRPPHSTKSKVRLHAFHMGGALVQLLTHEITRHLATPQDGILVCHKVTYSSLSWIPIYTPTWRESTLRKVSCQRKQHYKLELQTLQSSKWNSDQNQSGKVEPAIVLRLHHSDRQLNSCNLLRHPHYLDF